MVFQPQKVGGASKPVSQPTTISTKPESDKAIRTIKPLAKKAQASPISAPQRTISTKTGDQFDIAMQTRPDPGLPFEQRAEALQRWFQKNKAVLEDPKNFDKAQQILTKENADLQGLIQQKRREILSEAGLRFEEGATLPDLSTVDIPVQGVQGQDIYRFFAVGSQGLSFNKPGYEVEYWPGTNTIKRIYSTPAQYRKRRDNERKEYDTYIKDEYIFDTEGKLKEHYQRDDYTIRYSKSDKRTQETKAIFDKRVQKWDPQGYLIEDLKYDNIRTDYDRDREKDRTVFEEEPYLTDKELWDSGNLKYEEELRYFRDSGGDLRSREYYDYEKNQGKSKDYLTPAQKKEQKAIAEEQRKNLPDELKNVVNWQDLVPAVKKTVLEKYNIEDKTIDTEGNVVDIKKKQPEVASITLLKSKQGDVSNVMKEFSDQSQEIITSSGKVTEITPEGKKTTTKISQPEAQELIKDVGGYVEARYTKEQVRKNLGKQKIDYTSDFFQQSVAEPSTRQKILALEKGIQTSEDSGINLMNTLEALNAEQLTPEQEKIITEQYRTQELDRRLKDREMYMQNLETESGLKEFNATYKQLQQEKDIDKKIAEYEKNPTVENYNRIKDYVVALSKVDFTKIDQLEQQSKFYDEDYGLIQRSIESERQRAKKGQSLGLAVERTAQNIEDFSRNIRQSKTGWESAVKEYEGIKVKAIGERKEYLDTVDPFTTQMRGKEKEQFLSTKEIDKKAWDVMTSGVGGTKALLSRSLSEADEKIKAGSILKGAGYAIGGSLAAGYAGVGKGLSYTLGPVLEYSSKGYKRVPVKGYQVTGNVISGAGKYFKYKPATVGKTVAIGTAFATGGEIVGTARGSLAIGGKISRVASKGLAVGEVVVPVGLMGLYVGGTVLEAQQYQKGEQRQEFYGEKFLGEGLALTIGGGIGAKALRSGESFGIYDKQMRLKSKIARGKEYKLKKQGVTATKASVKALRSELESDYTFIPEKLSPSQEKLLTKFTDIKPSEIGEIKLTRAKESALERINPFTERKRTYIRNLKKYTPEQLKGLVRLPAEDIAPKMYKTTKFDVKLKGRGTEIPEEYNLELDKQGPSYYGGERIKFKQFDVVGKPAERVKTDIIFETREGKEFQIEQQDFGILRKKGKISDASKIEWLDVRKRIKRYDYELTGEKEVFKSVKAWEIKAKGAGEKFQEPAETSRILVERETEVMKEPKDVAEDLSAYRLEPETEKTVTREPETLLSEGEIKRVKQTPKSRETYDIEYPKRFEARLKSGKKITEPYELLKGKAVNVKAVEGQPFVTGKRVKGFKELYVKDTIGSISGIQKGARTKMFIDVKSTAKSKTYPARLTEQQIGIAYEGTERVPDIGFAKTSKKFIEGRIFKGDKPIGEFEPNKVILKDVYLTPEFGKTGIYSRKVGISEDIALPVTKQQKADFGFKEDYYISPDSSSKIIEQSIGVKQPEGTMVSIREEASLPPKSDIKLSQEIALKADILFVENLPKSGIRPKRQSRIGKGIEALKDSKLTKMFKDKRGELIFQDFQKKRLAETTEPVLRPKEIEVRPELDFGVETFDITKRQEKVKPRERYTRSYFTDLQKDMYIQQDWTSELGGHERLSESLKSRQRLSQFQKTDLDILDILQKSNIKEKTKIRERMDTSQILDIRSDIRQAEKTKIKELQKVKVKSMLQMHQRQQLTESGFGFDINIRLPPPPIPPPHPPPRPPTGLPYWLRDNMKPKKNRKKGEGYKEREFAILQLIDTKKKTEKLSYL